MTATLCGMVQLNPRPHGPRPFDRIGQPFRTYLNGQIAPGQPHCRKRRLDHRLSRIFSHRVAKNADKLLFEGAGGGHQLFSRNKRRKRFVRIANSPLAIKFEVTSSIDKQCPGLPRGRSDLLCSSEHPLLTDEILAMFELLRAFGFSMLRIPFVSKAFLCRNRSCRD